MVVRGGGAVSHERGTHLQRVVEVQGTYLQRVVEAPIYREGGCQPRF